MPHGPWKDCGAFSAADPTIFSRRSACQTAPEQPVWHIPTLPFCNFSCRMRVSGSQPMEDLSTPGQGQGEGPGDSESERSEDDDGDGRGRSERSERSSSRGRAPRHDDSQRKKKKSLTGVNPVRDFRRTAATYSPSWWASTIGADELNGSVRDGKRWILIALTTALYHLRDYTPGLIPVSERYRAISTGRLCHRWLYTSRLSTSWSTTTLKGSLILETASRLDAFSAYPDRTWIPGGAAGATTG